MGSPHQVQLSNAVKLVIFWHPDDILNSVNKHNQCSHSTPFVNMYGILVEALKYMIIEKYGEEVLHNIFTRAKVTSTTFSSHERYSEKLLPAVMSATAEATNSTIEEVGLQAGRFFVRFMCNYGYSDLMKASGRRFGDFLKGLDNMHEYFRFSYPKIRPPSFYCSKETSHGLILNYRSRRQGYISYVMGQLVEIGQILFNMDVQVKLLKKEQKGSFLFATLKISFENAGFETDQALEEKSLALNEFLPVDPVEFLNMFPFFIAFNKRLEIMMTGRALQKVMPNLIGLKIDEEFDLQRPCIKFTWDGCLHHLNNVFQLESSYPIQKKANQGAITFQVNDLIEDKVEIPEGHDAHVAQNEDELSEDDDVVEKPYLFLKGPMVYLKSQELIILLPTVTVEEVDSLFEMGLFIDDYGKADCNRELILASTQKSDDMKTMLEEEKQKAKDLSQMVKDIELQKKRARNLLSAMMPKAVAKELTSTGGIKKISYEYDEASIAFCKVNEFNTLTEPLQPMDVVNLLNMIYSTFDAVIDRHGVYKVETIGESYMISCGVPTPNDHHAEYLADTALELIVQVKDIKMKQLDGRRVLIKIGMHSGPVVGGVVGTVAPRFCLFGDSVNCASRMESHNKKPMSIQISVKTFEILRKQAPKMFKFEDRGEINVKGKGTMKCYSLFEKVGPARCDVIPIEDKLDDITSDDDIDEGTPLDEIMEDEVGSSMSRMSMGEYKDRDSSSRLTGSTSRASSVASSVHSSSNSRTQSLADISNDIPKPQESRVIGNINAPTPPPTQGESNMMHKQKHKGNIEDKEKERGKEKGNEEEKRRNKEKIKEREETSKKENERHKSRSKSSKRGASPDDVRSIVSSMGSRASIIHDKLTVSSTGITAQSLLSVDPGDIPAFENPAKLKGKSKDKPKDKDKTSIAKKNGLIDQMEDKEILQKEVREIVSAQIQDAVDMDLRRKNVPKNIKSKDVIPPIKSETWDENEEMVESPNRGEDMSVESSFASAVIPLGEGEECTCVKVKTDKTLRTKICLMM